MSLGSDLFGMVKTLFLVEQELTRLASEVDSLSIRVGAHDVRLAVIENTLNMTARSSRLILPGS